MWVTHPRREALPRGAAHSTVAKRNAVCTALCAGAGVNRRGAPSRTDVPMAALPPPRSVGGLFLVFWFVPCFWAGRSTLKGVNFWPIRPLVEGAGMGSWRHVAWPGSDALVWASLRTVERRRSAGGIPPRSLARQLFPYWVVLRLGRGAGLGASLGRRSRAGSKREPDSQLLLGTQICISGLESSCEAEVVAEGPGLALPAPSSHFVARYSFGPWRLHVGLSSFLRDRCVRSRP